MNSVDSKRDPMRATPKRTKPTADKQVMRYFRANYFSEGGMPLCVLLVPGQTEHLFHDHDFAELVLVTQGHGWHATRSDEHPLQAGDAFVIQPMEQHSYRDTSGLTLYNVLFDLGQMKLPLFDLARSPGYRALFALEPRLRSSHGFKSRLKLSPANLAVASDLLAQLKRELDQKRAGYQAVSAALFLQTIGFLSRCYSHIEDPGPRALLRLGAVLDHLESSLNEPVQLEELARLAGMSKSSFQRAFRRALNASPVDYLIRLRIQKACELLSGSELNIKEVAAASGFDDSNYFTRQFRRITGASPSDFRRDAERHSSDHIDAFDSKVDSGGKKSLVIGVDLLETVLGGTSKVQSIRRTQENGFRKRFVSTTHS